MFRDLCSPLVLAILLSVARPAPGITIEFDYSLDGPFPFFDTQEKKDVLEAAADVYEQLLVDELAAIEPSGDNVWQVSIPHPSNGGFSLQLNMTIPQDTIRIFVGGRDLPGDDIGSVDIGLVGGSGTPEWSSTVQERGQPNAIGIGATDFGHWGGALAFDTTTPFGATRDWNFDLDSLPGPEQHDLFTAVLHEIPKILGVGTADSWDTWTDFDRFEFVGPATVEQFGGPVPLDMSAPDNPTHFAPGTTSRVYRAGEPQEALNTRVLPVGVRKQLTDLDVAALRDIGWEIATPGPPLKAGDANQDLTFDQLDIIQVLQAAKYLTNLPATWGEGDWDSAPGGEPGNPPSGDGMFNQFDIIAALDTACYITCGVYAAKTPEGVPDAAVFVAPAFGSSDTSADLALGEFTRADALASDRAPSHGAEAVVPVPEPSAIAPLALGILSLLVGMLWRRRRPAQPMTRGIGRRMRVAAPLLAMTFAGWCAPVFAVILAVGDGQGNTTAPPDDPGWSNVGSYGDYTATYLGNRWAIAADHVEYAPAIVFDGVSIPVVPGSEIPVPNPSADQLSDDAAILLDPGAEPTEFTDLRLIRLSEDPGLPALTIAHEPPPFLDETTDIIMMGYGRDRDPDLSTWVVDNVGGNEFVWQEVDDEAFNVSGYQYAPAQTKQWGTNRIIADAIAQGLDQDLFALVTQFNGDPSLATEFESQASKGDSGGAVFYQNDGDWELTGILVAVGNALTNQPEDTAVFGNFTILADLSVYRQNILELTSPRLFPGDANQDFSFDQLDIVQVLVAGKYLSGEPATWGDGDWNGGPGGFPGNPPQGDGRFDQLDIVAALATGHYLSGPQLALAATDLQSDFMLSHDPANLSFAAVPEPSSMLLLAFGLLPWPWRLRSR